MKNIYCAQIYDVLWHDLTSKRVIWHNKTYKDRNNCRCIVNQWLILSPSILQFLWVLTMMTRHWAPGKYRRRNDGRRGEGTRKGKGWGRGTPTTSSRHQPLAINKEEIFHMSMIGRGRAQQSSGEMERSSSQPHLAAAVDHRPVSRSVTHTASLPPTAAHNLQHHASVVSQFVAAPPWLPTDPRPRPRH